MNTTPPSVIIAVKNIYSKSVSGKRLRVYFDAVSQAKSIRVTNMIARPRRKKFPNTCHHLPHTISRDFSAAWKYL